MKASYEDNLRRQLQEDAPGVSVVMDLNTVARAHIEQVIESQQDEVQIIDSDQKRRRFVDLGVEKRRLLDIEELYL